MSQNNSIINSLKRLERVGSETSRVTTKLKEACEDVAKKIFEIARPFRKDHNPMEMRNYTFTRIWGEKGSDGKYISGLYIVENNADYFYRFDYDNELCEEDIDVDRYLITHAGYMSRECALEFAHAVANGLIDQVAIWVENKKLEAEEALKKIESAKENL